MYLTDAGDIAEQFQFRNENIGSLLNEWVSEHPDKVLMHWHPFTGEGRAWTYQQFWDEACAVAAGLQQRGINAGDKVILHCDNCPEMVISWYACALIGAVAVTTNTGATATEMEHFISTTQPVAAITQPKYMEMLSRFKDRFEWMVTTEANSDLSVADAADNPPFEAFAALKDETGSVALADCGAMTPAGILFTSGTTGLSKAVVHTHGNWLWSPTMGPLNIDMRAGDVMLTYMPFFHVNSQMWSTAIAIGVGASIVLLPKVTVSRYWPIVQKYGVTHHTMMPLVLGVASKSIPEKHSLKRIGMAELSDVSKAWNARFHSIFGSSETIIHCLASSPHRHWPDRVLGRTVPGYQCQVVNPETLEMSKPGETGELWVKGTRGVQMFLEYYNDPEATESAFVDGWFRTGDGIRLGENGHMYFTQRLKDMIKVGGENVGVGEVEAVIMQLPEVYEVAVVAKKHEALDEVPVAFVIGAEGADLQQLESRILDHCREHMSAFKIPRHVCLVDDFPRALLNKVAKNKLREMAEKL
jgi:crotonobetaine/carnitine-CoA ligase